MAHSPLFVAFCCRVELFVLIVLGRLRDFCGRLSGVSRYKTANRPGFAPLLPTFANFYIRRIYHRFRDVLSRPVGSAPGSHIDVIERYSPDGNKTLINKVGVYRRCLNLSSYNYLGFADDWLATCSKSVLPTVELLGAASVSPVLEFGTSSVHVELEATIAKFIGKPAALVYHMGFGTNTTSIPAFMGKGSLIISDALNHTSLVNGMRTSGATVCVFRHNELDHLEQLLREKISKGQPRTHRPWTKVLVVVEGIYSMEGEIVDLRGVVDIVKKYKAYLYVDEAHSIGALGKTGRGICEHAGVDPSEVDILMGTFSKSFGGMGGYIAASEEIIDTIRASSAGTLYTVALSPVVAQQVLTAFNLLLGSLGSQRLVKLRENSNHFRRGLEAMGLLTLGDVDSPVIPVLLFHMTKCHVFSRLCMERNLAVATVASPGVPLFFCRARFCISAAHTREDLDVALQVIREVSDICGVRFNKRQAIAKVP